MFEMVRLSVGLEAQKAGIESNCQDSFSLSFCRWLLIHNQYKNSGLIFFFYINGRYYFSV